MRDVIAFSKDISNMRYMFLFTLRQQISSSGLYEIQIFELLYKSPWWHNTRRLILISDVSGCISPEIYFIKTIHPRKRKFNAFDFMIQSILFLFSFQFKEKLISLIHYNRCVLFNVWWLVGSLYCLCPVSLSNKSIEWFLCLVSLIVGWWLEILVSSSVKKVLWSKLISLFDQMG